MYLHHFISSSLDSIVEMQVREMQQKECQAQQEALSLKALKGVDQHRVDEGKDWKSRLLEKR